MKRYGIAITNPFTERWPFIFYINNQEDLEIIKKQKNYKIEENNLIKVDFETDKVILVLFEQGSGGNFLCNCLSLSDTVATKYNKIKSKIIKLKEHIDTTDIFWKDFLLSDVSTYNPCGNEKYFFVTDHFLHNGDGDFRGMNTIKYHLSYWKNCKKVIIIKNSKLFCSLRRCVWKSSIDGKIVFDDDGKITLGDYFQLSSNDRNKLKNEYNDLDEKYSHCDAKYKVEYYFWDNNWFLSKNDTIFNMKNMYDMLELDGYNEKVISYYYDIWIKKLIDLREILI